PRSRTIEGQQALDHSFVGGDAVLEDLPRQDLGGVLTIYPLRIRCSLRIGGHLLLARGATQESREAHGRAPWNLRGHECTCAPAREPTALYHNSRARPLSAGGAGTTTRERKCP